MSARCPEGHLSDALDYCDVCGAPMGAGGGVTPGDAAGLAGSISPGVPGAGLGAPDVPEAPAQAATQTCPHCGALNVADALFCEACGYDFTTGTPPMDAGPAASSAPLVGSDDAGYGVHAPEESTASDPVSSASAPVEATESGHSPEEDGGDGDEGGGDDGDGDDGGDDGAVGDRATGDQDGAGPEQISTIRDIASDHSASSEQGPTLGDDDGRASGDQAEDDQAEHDQAEDEKTEPPAPAPAAVPAHRKARHTPPSRALAEAWVAELWVDPDWYAVQQTDEACPSAGVPDIVMLTRSAALIGRPSGSLGVRPEIDAGADSAVSRRHAQLTSDGQRWFVEDLGSSNGTFVGTVGEPLPTAPVPPGQRVEIDRDDRLYVGAWTRIVLRQATASEREGTG